jgi:hypothetical protein
MLIHTYVGLKIVISLVVTPYNHGHGTLRLKPSWLNNFQPTQHAAPKHLYPALRLFLLQKVRDLAKSKRDNRKICSNNCDEARTDAEL